MTGKYHAENLLPALRLFVEARNRAIESGFTDNGGAIHSVERILDILSLRICYPFLRHINNLKSHNGAERSKSAQLAIDAGEKVFIEHVMPQRAYARKVVDLVTSGASDAEIIAFIRSSYRLALLTADETLRLNRLNRSSWSENRLADAGIEIQDSKN